MNVLCIGAHPDDIELSCSGTLLKHIKNGKKVGIIDLTQGELGSRGSAEIRLVEASESGKILGLSARENLKMKDGFFEIMVNYYQKHGSASKLTNQYLNDEFNQRNLKAIKSALEYHSTHAYQLEYPYWLSNHGMNHFNMVMNNRQNSSKKDIFISALDSRKKEAQLITIFKKAAKII